MAPPLPLPLPPPPTLPLPSLLPPPIPLSPFFPCFTTFRTKNSPLVLRHPLAAAAAAASSSSSSSSCNSTPPTLALHSLSCQLPKIDARIQATHFPASPQPRCFSAVLEFASGNGLIHPLLAESFVRLVVIALTVAPFLQPNTSAAAEREAAIFTTASFLQLTAKEPLNALSLPTWSIHVASVAEWITAMILVWQYGETEGNESWKGLSWGMVPLLGGAMCACTWHFFYNAESLEALVIFQGALTLIGNFTLWIAAFRIYKKVQEKA